MVKYPGFPISGSELKTTVTWNQNQRRPHVDFVRQDEIYEILHIA